MFKLTKQQISAIAYLGNLVITACPGSGKTTVISEKIRNELLELKRHQGVIAITFTRKASKELNNRCKRGGKETKSSFFGTIDAFCLSEIIFPFAKSIFGPHHVALEPKFTGELSAQEQLILDGAQEIHGELSAENFEGYLPEIKKLYMLGCIYFPTIPFLANHITKYSKACRNYLKARYTTAYIDEYQDSSWPQHELFLTLLDIGIRGVCVGDIQQSIYGWRNSSPDFLKQLINSPKFHHLTVTINHRCHPSIANYANRLFDDICEIEPINGEMRVFQCEVEGTELDCASKLNRIIPSVIKKHPINKNSDIAILVRYNKGLERLREKLTIPNKIYTEDILSKIESKASQLWVALLEFRYSTSTLVDDIINTFSTESEIRRERLKNLRASIKIVKSVDNDELPDAMIKILQLLLGTQATIFEVNALKQVITDPELLSQYHPATDNQIQCMTLHKSKGLEFDIVIHLDLVDWVFPRRVPGKDFNQRLYPDLDQDLNLHYVGVTRAKRACLLVHTTQRINAQGLTKQAEPSIFLKQPGLEDLYKKVNT